MDSMPCTGERDKGRRKRRGKKETEEGASDKSSREEGKKLTSRLSSRTVPREAVKSSPAKLGKMQRQDGLRRAFVGAERIMKKLRPRQSMADKGKTVELGLHSRSFAGGIGARYELRVFSYVSRLIGALHLAMFGPCRV